MRQYTAENLVIRGGNPEDPDQMVEVRPEQAGWDTLNFQSRRIAPGASWAWQTGSNELALVVLGGCVDIDSDRGTWSGVGARATVFDGLPSALYLPRNTSFTVKARIASEFAVAWVAAEGEFSPRLVTPADVSIEIRGGDNATRQINSIIPPGFPCARLVVVEVYTPGGNWSSYPPHKHDLHRTGPDGRIVEADLDEIYYYKIDRPEGFALQRIYTAPESPLHKAGFPIDAAVVAQNDDVVLVPEGYHPVCSPFGYTTYYLNVLAGSAQSLACSDDPLHAWVKDVYRARDPRVPFFTASEAQKS
jgi:5-deoxy-glucuronate isomerase